jgi:hypothetical protein
MFSRKSRLLFSGAFGRWIGGGGVGLLCDLAGCAFFFAGLELLSNRVFLFELPLSSTPDLVCPAATAGGVGVFTA